MKPTPLSKFTGARFGKLVVLQNDGHGLDSKVLCRCDCGKTKMVSLSDMRRGNTSSCGCAWHDHKLRPLLIGFRQGKLCVTSNYREEGSYVVCRCDCGTEVRLAAWRVRKGYVKSCGCLLTEFNVRTKRLHGESGRSGKGATPEYLVWAGMVDRCTSPTCNNYPRYGGRGIKVCERWATSYSNFLADVGRRPSPEHSIGRMDNDGHYEPGNVRWETMAQQSNNKRTSVFLEFRGRKQTVAQWADELGLNRGTLKSRVSEGWPVDLALTTKPLPRSQRIKGLSGLLADLSR